MRQVLLTRASTLANITNLLQDAGAQVERGLHKFNLPTELEPLFGYYVPVLQCLDFVRYMERREHIDDIIYRSFDGVQSPNLENAPYSNGLRPVNLRDVLQNFCSFVHWENPGFRFSIQKNSKLASITVTVDDMLRGGGNHYSDWTIVLQLISIIRACLGSPPNLQAVRIHQQFNPCEAAQEEFSHCEFRTGCSETEISFPAEYLTSRLPELQHSIRPPDDAGVSGTKAEIGFPMSLEMSLRSYVQEGRLDINLAAEISRTSVRTLQRRLSSYKLSYTQIIQRSRFEVATELLHDRDNKIIDVALAAGYDDPSHFARAFRKIAGVSPTEYRRITLSE